MLQKAEKILMQPEEHQGLLDDVWKRVKVLAWCECLSANTKEIRKCSLTLNFSLLGLLWTAVLLRFSCCVQFQTSTHDVRILISPNNSFLTVLYFTVPTP